MEQDAGRWLLLLHHLPPHPPYFRAKVLRRLSQVGALPLKNSAYLLPEREDTQEDFEWIVQEIQREGGGAWLFRAELLAGYTRAQIEQAFVRLRAADYQGLLVEVNEVSQLSHTDRMPVYAKLARRYDEICKIDFFPSRLREQAETAMKTLEAQVRSLTNTTRKSPPAQAKTWVTRQGVKVDRIASAWLIRNFIDAKAKFRFVDPDRHAHTPGELRFDMFDGEYTHRGEWCTFEVLINDFGLGGDAGLAALAELIHDIDLKDEKYRRPETAGLAKMLEGLYRRVPGDIERIQKGEIVFSALHESLRAS